MVSTVWKMSKYEVISGPYFPVFGLNTGIYGVNLFIQSEYSKIRTRNNSVFGHFSRSTHWPLNPKVFVFYKEKYIKYYPAWYVEFKVLKFQTLFSQNILFICCDIWSEIIVICLHLKHVSLGFNICRWHF